MDSSCPTSTWYPQGTHMDPVSMKHMGCPYGTHIGLLIKTIWAPYCNSYGLHMGFFYVLHHGCPPLGHRWHMLFATVWPTVSQWTKHRWPDAVLQMSGRRCGLRQPNVGPMALCYLGNGFLTACGHWDEVVNWLIILYMLSQTTS